MSAADLRPLASNVSLPLIMRSVLLILTMVALFPTESVATKPCPKDSCRDAASKFQRAECTERADWIAVGRITNVRHHVEGNPLNKDFARFDFNIERWEKGRQKGVDKLTFEVGWCFNRSELPTDITGQFRFYGTNSLGAGQESGPTYLDFEKLTSRSTGLLPSVAIRH